MVVTFPEACLGGAPDLPAAVYVTLKRIEKKGLVRSTMSGGEGRATRDYTILPAGHDAMARSRAMLEQLWDEVGVESA